MIVERDGKFYLMTHDGAKQLGGPYDTEAQALEREQEVKRFAIKKAGSGLIVMFKIPLDEAIKFAPAGGESVEMLHLTLAYMGDDALPDGAFDAVTRAVQSVCCEAKPVTGLVNGVGRFNASESSNGMDVIYASFDSADLLELRNKIVAAIESQLVPVRKNHGFVPHITLKYVYPFDEQPLPKVQTLSLTFNEVCVAMAGDTRHIPLGAQREPYLDLTSEAERLAHLGVPGSLVSGLPQMDESRIMALRMLGLHVVEKEDDAPEPVPVRVIKMDDARRLVYGVVLRPLEMDTQGHVMTPADVEYAAHHYLGSNGIMGDRHRAVADAVCVESFIAPCDFQLGGEIVKAGDWVLVSYVRDDALWAKIVNGEYQGYSVGGFGQLASVK